MMKYKAVVCDGDMLDAILEIWYLMTDVSRSLRLEEAMRWKCQAGWVGERPGRYVVPPYLTYYSEEPVT